MKKAPKQKGPKRNKKWTSEEILRFLNAYENAPRGEKQRVLVQYSVSPGSVWHLRSRHEKQGKAKSRKQKAKS
jgi:hypothetical protein